MELFLDVLGESLVDTAKMLPFLFLAYLFIEYVENRHGERIEAILAGGGRWGSVPAALLGCVPQCGFSAIASNFYASRVISLGTLMAVFLATSDEAVPLLVSMPAYWNKLVLLMVIKVLYAIAVGLVLDFVLRGVLPRSLRGGYSMVLPGTLKCLHVTGRFHHTDDRAVPLGTGTDGAELGFGIILADTAAVELGVGVLDRTRQCGGILIRHAQYLIGHPGRTLPPNARELAEFFDQLFQRGCIITHGAPPL